MKWSAGAHDVADRMATWNSKYVRAECKRAADIVAEGTEHKLGMHS